MIDSCFSHADPVVPGELGAHVAEPAPGRVQIFSGPRQAGKTRLLLDLCRHRRELAAPLLCERGSEDVGRAARVTVMSRQGYLLYGPPGKGE